jgi:glucose-6-phosphate-specific signal transduction histidine kinase
VSSSSARAIQRNSVSKNKTKQNKTKQKTKEEHNQQMSRQYDTFRAQLSTLQPEALDILTQPKHMKMTLNSIL